MPRPPPATATRTLLAIALLGGCSSGMADHDAVFLEVQVKEVAASRCAEAAGLCVALTASVDGRRTAEGSCRLFGPGDPDRMTPLAESGPLEMVPDEDTVWVVALPGAVDVRQLNPVCTPMIEG